MESFLEAWDLICDYCKKQVTDVSYETWFSKLVPISLDFGAGVAIIQAPNEFNKSTIERGFHKCLNDAVQSVFGEAFTYKLITPMEKKEKERVPDDDEYEYTFETFIEGRARPSPRQGSARTARRSPAAGACRLHKIFSCHSAAALPFPFPGFSLFPPAPCLSLPFCFVASVIIITEFLVLSTKYIL